MKRERIRCVKTSHGSHNIYALKINSVVKAVIDGRSESLEAFIKVNKVVGRTSGFLLKRN